MKVRQDARWLNAHIGLRRVYEERVPRGMSQAEFGASFALGSQGMVWQYLNGYTPLNYDAAAKFAKGLRCTIRDFSPEMAEALEAEILPVLGRRARKVAGLALLCLGMLMPPAPADAAPRLFDIIVSYYTLRAKLRRLWRYLSRACRTELREDEIVRLPLNCRTVA